MLHPGYVRHYESTIRFLAAKGHQILLTFNQPQKQAEDQLPQMLTQGNPNILISPVQTPKRGIRWRYLVRAIYGGMDYLRYFQPIYDNAPKFKARVETRLGRVFGPFLNGFLFVTKGMGIKFLSNCLRAMARAIPLDERLRRFIQSEKPDLILVTPLVNIASDQTDIFQLAKALGIRNALCVASWDNLTNKGLCRLEPGKVIVWNEMQKREAIDLHGIPASKVAVTGAQCYDKWFEQKPSLSKGQFLKKVDLPSEKQYILYICSSPFITPNEVNFVEKWIKSIRECDDLNIRNMAILVRPHPQNAEQWKEVDFSCFESVSIYPRSGANPVHDESKADFYHSMYYSSAVMGINTSAMIESGILGKPCFTIVADDFRSTQEGTLHFHYLAEGGLLFISNHFNEHIKQLREVLNGDESYLERIKIFIKDFVRPHGLDVSCTPIIGGLIEDFGKSPAPEPERAPWWAYPLRVLLLPLSIVFLAMQEEWRGVIKGFRGALKEEQKTLKKKLRRGGQKPITFIRPILHFVAGYIRKNSFMRKRVIPWLIKEEIGKVASSSKIIEIERDIKNISRSTNPIIVGPWLSEIGFEVLYWIPFLKWAIKDYGIDKERIIVISRGGTEQWYRGITNKYIDVFDYFTEDEFRKKNQDRINDAGGQKHRMISDFDLEILKQVKKTLQIEDHEWLHPSFMYGMFKCYWDQKHSMNLVARHTSFEMFEPVSGREILEKLPESYVAVKFYFSECFPDTEENRRFISDLLRQLARKSHVVLFSTGLKIDDHEDFNGEVLNRIHSIKDLISPRNNLDIQTRILSGASAFVGTYGGFSYLAPFYGVPSISFYSRGDKFLPVHLEVINRALRVLKYGAFNKVKIANHNGDGVKGNPEFLVFSVKNIDILQGLFKGDDSHDTEL